MIIKIIIFLILLSSCSNKYLGTVDEDYIPTKKIIHLNKNNINLSSAKIEFSNAELIENFDIFQAPKINLKIKKFNKVDRLFKNDSISNFVNYENNIIYIAKNYSLNSYSDSKVIAKSFIPKNFEKKKNYFFNIILEKNILYVISNYGEVFKINKDWSFSLLATTNKKINFLISNYGKLLFTDLNGGLIAFDIDKNSFNTLSSMDINFGYINKHYDVNTYENFLFHNINTNTLAIIDLKNQKFINKYTLDSLNILSPIGDIGTLVNTPVNLKDSTLFVGEMGKLFNFKIDSDKIFWNLDLNKIIIDFIVHSNVLFLLTDSQIYVYELNNGKLISNNDHNIFNPSFFSIVNSKLLIVGENNLSLIDPKDVNIDTPIIFKFKKNNINAIGYSLGNYYLKNEDAVYLLSE